MIVYTVYTVFKISETNY